MITSLISVLISVVVLVLIGYLVIWILGALAPGHPDIIDRLIWVVVVLLSLLMLLQLFVVLPTPHLLR